MRFVGDIHNLDDMKAYLSQIEDFIKEIRTKFDIPESEKLKQKREILDEICD